MRQIYRGVQVLSRWSFAIFDLGCDFYAKKGLCTLFARESQTERGAKEAQIYPHKREESPLEARNPFFVTEDTIGLATAALTSTLDQNVWKLRNSYIFSAKSKFQYEKNNDVYSNNKEEAK